MAVMTITDSDSFTEAVLRAERPVLVAFRSGACRLSQELIPTVDAVAEKFDGQATFVAVDVDDHPRDNKICRIYNVTRLPIMMLFEDGAVRDFIGGATTKESIATMVEERLKPVLTVGVTNFDAEVLAEVRPVLVHFHAASCAASELLVPVLDSVASRYVRRAKFVRVEFGSDNAGLCARYGIIRTPTLALFHGGTIMDQILGAPGEEGDEDFLVGSTNISRMVEEFIV